MKIAQKTLRPTSRALAFFPDETLLKKMRHRKEMLAGLNFKDSEDSTILQDLFRLWFRRQGDSPRPRAGRQPTSKERAAAHVQWRIHVQHFSNSQLLPAPTKVVSS